MSGRRHRLFPAILALVVLAAGIFVALADPPLATALRNQTFDAFQRWRPRPYRPAPVKIVDIDEESIGRLGQWPWPRSRVAQLVDRARAAGATAVAFDIDFAEVDRTSPAQALAPWRGDPEVDALVRRLPDYDRALAREIARGDVVTGFVLNQNPQSDRRPEIKAAIATAGDDPLQFLPVFRGAVASRQAFESGAAGNGALNFTPGRDGVVRRLPLILALDDAIYPTLVPEALRVTAGESTYLVRSSGASGASRFGGKTGIVSIRFAGREVETDPEGQVWLYYSGSIPERMVPAWQLLEGEESALSALDGSIALVGTSAPGLFDLRHSSLGQVVPGVEIHAELAEQILAGTYLVRPDWAPAAEILFVVLAWLLVVPVVLRSGALWSAILTAGAIAAASGASWTAFTQARLLVDPVFPSLTLLVVYLVGSITRHRQTERERSWIRKAFSTYISPNLVSHLIEHPELLSLGGERRTCSFVFTDLADFTPLVEQAEPEVAVGILNEYLEGMVRIALSHEGTLDRVVGDAVAVMFSAPAEQPDHAERALACALEMDRFSEEFGARKRAEGIPVGLTRIGVNSGEVTVGNIGGSSLFDYRALGDPVNTAARLEAVNGQLGTRVCVSAATARASALFVGRPAGRLWLKGKSEPIEAFEPLTERESTSERVNAYREAYALLERRDAGVRAAFERLVESYPDDGLAAFHLKRLERGETGVEVTAAGK